ncbi:MAG: hypothetical protein F6K19_07015 [Cyanothece sp. SIO1E1]|nr:hypothetical protein [Cyanothece sp. SIO1E1]
MKKTLSILWLIILDFVLIWLWVYDMDPDPSVSIGMIILMPFVFGINAILACIFHFLKKKEFAQLFWLNSLIASVIMFWLFKDGIRRHVDKRWESWGFYVDDKSYRLTRSKEDSTFYISIRLSSGSSQGLLSGTYYREGSGWKLKSDDHEMIIQEDRLINFKNDRDTIPLIPR